VFNLAIVYLYMCRHLLTWSEPFELYRFGQKLAISVYPVMFIAVTRTLRTRMPAGFHNLLRLSIFTEQDTALAPYPHLGPFMVALATRQISLPRPKCLPARVLLQFHSFWQPALPGCGGLY